MTSGSIVLKRFFSKKMDADAVERCQMTKTHKLSELTEALRKVCGFFNIVSIRVSSFGSTASY